MAAAVVLALASMLPVVVPGQAAAGAASVECLGANGLGYTQGNTPTNLMAGKLTIPGFGVTYIGTGDVDFVALNAGRHPTWQLWFNSLKWLEPLIGSYAAGQAGSDAYLARAAAIAADWSATYPERTPRYEPAWNGQATSLRTQTLACLNKYRTASWLTGSLDAHGRHLADARNYIGDWNQGLEQNIGLLMAACARSNAAWISTAEDRAHTGLLGLVDAEGAFNEQAPGYGSWTITRWWTIEKVLGTCGRPGLADLDARLRALATWMAYATQPDGTLVQIGDTFAEPIRSDVAARYPEAGYAASKGASGTAPTSTVKIYKAGYVFSRSGWGTQRPFTSESLLTMRFGPMRFAHGHFDHGSVTWFDRGRKLLVDGGHVGYENTAYRTWLKSPEAHNTFTAPAVPLRTYGQSKLTRSEVTAAGRFFEMTDDAGTAGGAYQGLVRYRGVFQPTALPALVVLDRVNGSKLRWMYTDEARRKVAWWHLDPAFTVASVGRSSVTATAGTTKMTIMRVPFPGEVVPAGGSIVKRGAANPYQGWVSTAQGRKISGAAIGHPTTSWRHLTILVPSSLGAAVTTNLVATTYGHRLSIKAGSTVTVVRIGKDARLYV